MACWPPGPDERLVRSSISASGIATPRADGIGSSTHGADSLDCAAMRVAVVGHVEWIEFARVERVPAAGRDRARQEAWEEPGGGGAVAAVQLAKLAGGATLFTALGDDELGHRAKRELEALGLRGARRAWRDRAAAPRLRVRGLGAASAPSP